MRDLNSTASVRTFTREITLFNPSVESFLIDDACSRECQILLSVPCWLIASKSLLVKPHQGARRIASQAMLSARLEIARDKLKRSSITICDSIRSISVDCHCNPASLRLGMRVFRCERLLTKIAIDESGPSCLS